MSKKDFLVELGCEELPPKSLKTLRDDFAQGIRNGLEKAGLAFDAMQAFAAPRRLAVIVEQLIEQQPDRRVIIDGPPVKAAFDAAGKPTPAALGFAKKNGVDISELDRSGDKLRFIKQESGQSATDLLPGIVQAALDALPIAKRMRWGASRVEFVRPVQWLVMLLGDRVVDCEILGQKAGHDSHGHRFHHPDTVDIANAASYVGTLRRANVIADFDERRALIAEKVDALAKAQGGRALIPEALLDEVTALVEWPVPLACEFESRFLAVPQEALISTMQDNQKYFCLVDGDGKLMNRFITVANIESTDPQRIVDGNQKVVRPRLSDAEFFFNTDKKTSLESRRAALGNIVFQQQLGTLLAKSERVERIAVEIAKRIGGDIENTARAAQLCKCDLVTGMVGEFPELQGIMGEYYALSDSENTEVARALREQYLPKSADDELPATNTGIALALADRIDTLVGIFGIGQPPTGSKDPFALRRAAIGVLNIITKKSLALDLRDIISAAAGYFPALPKAASVIDDVLAYVIERFRALYQAEGFATEVFLAVQAKNITAPQDFDARVRAVRAFTQLPQAQALAAANKRVSNILAKHDGAIAAEVDSNLLVEIAERALALSVTEQQQKCAPLFAKRQYAEALESLATLRDVVDAFFDNVMVNADDAALRNNRIALLAQLRALFLEVADISVLATTK
jgi:glycyl-tRNA synthetase beta chain